MANVQAAGDGNDVLPEAASQALVKKSPRPRQKTFWSMQLDGHVMDRLYEGSLGETFELSSAEFVEHLYKLPRPLLNELLHLPQEEMFMRIFCYWKNLNVDRAMSKRRRRRKSLVKISQSCHENLTADDQNRRQDSHQRKYRNLSRRKVKLLPHDVKAKTLDKEDSSISKRRPDEKCIIYVEPSESDESSEDNLSDLENILADASGTKDDLENILANASGTKPDLEAVVTHSSVNDVVPFSNSTNGGSTAIFSAFWTWIVETLGSRRQRRVGPCASI